MASFICDNFALSSFIFGVTCFVTGFLLCALLVMARRSSDDYEGK